MSSPEKSVSANNTPKGIDASQDDFSTSCQLTVQGFLCGLQNPVTLPCKPVEAGQAFGLQPTASRGNGDSPSLDSGPKISSPGLLDPPESVPSETDRDRVSSPSFVARRVRFPDPDGRDESDLLMKIPKVIRTYSKKIKRELPVRTNSNHSSSTRSSAHKGPLPDDLLSGEPATPNEELASKEPHNSRPATKDISAPPQKSKRRTLQDDDDFCRDNRSGGDADMLISEVKTRTKQKKRRAPVDELALVTRLIPHSTPAVKARKAYDSDDAIDSLNECVDRQGSPTFTLSRRPRSQKPMRANVGKPVTKIRRENTVPQQELLAREGFKFPPSTPRVTKPPGWRLGSGFDGITLKASTGKRPPILRSKKVHARIPFILGRSLSELELANTSSPNLQSVEDQDGPVKTRNFRPAKEIGIADGAFDGRSPQSTTFKAGEIPAFVQLASLPTITNPLSQNDRPENGPSIHHDDTSKEPMQLHCSQKRNLNSSQSVREPSNSERHGWLRRRTVHFAVANEDEDEQLFKRTQITPVNISGLEKKIGSRDSYLDDNMRLQSVGDRNLQAFDAGGQTTQNPERLIPSQQRCSYNALSPERPRCRVSHDAGGKGSELQDLFDSESLNSLPETPLTLDSEADPPTSSACLTELPSIRNRIEVSRTSEVAETQERPQESIELDGMMMEPGQYPIEVSVTTLDSGNYFSRAVQQLESLERMPHTVTQRRSRREPEKVGRVSRVTFEAQEGAQHVDLASFAGGHAYQKQEGPLQLGLTPRLKESL